MARGRAAVHSEVAGDSARARCGWLYVQTTADGSKVTCKSCRKLLDGGRVARPRAPTSGPEDVVQALASTLGGDLQPTAPSPPRLDVYSWSQVCKVNPETQSGRCGNCLLCAHERELDRYAAVSPWNDGTRLRLDRDPSAPTFGSLNAALVALWEWRAHDRHAASALGPMLDRVRLGQTGGKAPSGTARRSRLLDRADDIAHVDRALREAYRAGDNPAGIPPHVAELLLLVRTPGVVPGGSPTYVDIAAGLIERDYATMARTLKRTVRHGRRSVIVELAARGLIPRPGSRHADAADLWEAIADRQVELSRDLAA